MYTRSYPEEDKIAIPEGYGGNAFREDIQEKEERREDGRDDSVSVGSFLDKLLPSSLGNLFSGNLFKNFRLGWEELLILGVAALLFFSREGDKECALMLLLLIFIS